MKQILQNLKTGQTKVAEIPCPINKRGYLRIKTQASLISAGTEHMLLEFGKANLLGKIRQQPDKVRQVLTKVKTDGLISTIKSVRSKLDQPLSLGYSNAGIVENLDSGRGVSEFKIGDRIVSNGTHSEIVCVPYNLCAKIPENVSYEEAAYTVVGAIALQGVRLAQPTLGECFVVTGLGLIGLITVQIMLANGCRVIGIDPDKDKCKIAGQFGIETISLSAGEDPVIAAISFSRGQGVDGVLITASTKSNEPMHQAAQMCRKRGRIVLVGITGLELSRADFYEKELSFQVSCSYGPGRYDPDYEEKGHDYPIGFVRWTEKRNFEAVLDLMATGKLDVKQLISHKFNIEDAEDAYRLIVEKKEPYIGIILKYNKDSNDSNEKEIKDFNKEKIFRLKDADSCLMPSSSCTLPTVGVVGAGNFTGMTLLPTLKKTGARLKTIASSGGVTSTHFGKKFNFEQSTTDVEEIFKDSEINTVFITTRHNMHVHFVLMALKAGKHVFVEKPLCLTLEELEEITTFFSSQPIKGQDFPLLMVGFNRRFAPHIIKIKSLLDANREPKSFIMTVNAGFIPDNHWTQDSEVGGGRIIGEACHFVDLLRFLANDKIDSSNIVRMKNKTGDTVTITLSFADGSIGTIHYFANGNKAFPKERLEIFCGGKILQLNNFKILKGYGWKNFTKMSFWQQDKGHATEVAAFIEAVKKGGPFPIPLEEIMEVTKKTIDLATHEEWAGRA